MKILLLNPPSLDTQYINRDLMGGLGVNLTRREGLAQKLMGFLKARSIRLPVLSLVYCATVLAKDHDVIAVDAANEDLPPAKALDRIEAAKPDLVLSTTSISALLEEAEFASQIKERTGAEIGLMGDAATMYHEEILSRFPIDFIVQGDEPESVVGALRERRDYRNASGIINRTEDGKLRRGADPGMIVDLDSLSFPRWDLFPVQRYRYFPSLRKTPFVTALSSRGCPYGCIYCPYTSNQGLKYRYRSPENVVEELFQLRETHGVRSVLFRDPTFTLRKDRTLGIAALMKERKLDLEWGCETRVDCLNENMIDRMVEVGLRGVSIGIEGIDPQVIRNVKRGWIDPEHIRKMVTHMAQSGVRVSGFFVLGLPGETESSVEKTLDFAMSLPLSYAEFKVATPFPGTPLFEMARREGWTETVELSKYTSYTPAMKIPGGVAPVSLQVYANDAYRRFYFRPFKMVREMLNPSFVTTMFKILVTGVRATS